jgi:hypothetical protein
MQPHAGTTHRSYHEPTDNYDSHLRALCGLLRLTG